MRTISRGCLITTAIVMIGAPAWAQTDVMLDGVVQRLKTLEVQDAALRDRVQRLEQEIERLKQPGSGGASTTSRLDALDEQVALQAGRLSEQDQLKTQSSQRVPVRLMGTLMFSLFRNSEHGILGGGDYPVAARTDSAPAAWAGTLRRSIIGMQFQTPDAMFGGQFRGSFFMDLTEAGDAFANTQPRLRTGAIEGRWGGFAILAGFDKPIFSARDPTSLAQVQFGALTGAGNFWLSRPQIRLEQTVRLGQRREFRARIGMSQAPETGGPFLRNPARASRATGRRWRDISNLPTRWTTHAASKLVRGSTEAPRTCWARVSRQISSRWIGLSSHSNGPNSPALSSLARTCPREAPLASHRDTPS